MYRFLHVLAIAVLVSGRAVNAAPPGNGWTQVWSDEFDGTALDGSKWSNFTGQYRNGFMSGTAPDVSVGNGILTILTWTNAASGVHHTGWIGTQGHFDAVYGYWEARIRFNGASATWSAFWLQPDSINTVSTPPDPANNGTEIDIVEHRKQDASGANISDKAYEALHWNSYGTAGLSGGPGLVNNWSGNSALQGNWHTYGLHWTPAGYTFYIDSVQVASSTQAVSMRGQWIYLSTIIGGGSFESWAGQIPSGGYGDASTSTTKMEVDYVRFFRPAEGLEDADLEARKQPWAGSNSNWVSGTNGVEASSGTTGAALSAASATATLAQTVYGLQPNTGYVLTGWGRGAATIGVNSHGGTEVSQIVTGTSFAKATVPFTTGAFNRTATIFARAAAGSGTSYVDDFLLRRGATVTNGSLERGDDVAWNLYGGTVVADSGSIHSGTYALTFPASTSSAGAEQEVVGLTPGTAYRLSAWTNNGGKGLTFGVKNHGGSQVTTGVTASVWTRGTVNFTTGASNTTGTIFAFRGSSTAAEYADSFFLAQPLPAPWVSQDVTTIPLAGTSGVRGTKFAIQAAGADIWSTSDKFHFVNRPMTGDCQLTARILGLDATNAAAKTGVMMRESATSFVRSVTVDWTPAGTVEVLTRSASSGSTSAVVVTGITDPPWVRLLRRGNVFTASYSTDGVAWTVIGAPQTVAMSTSMLVGLPACSHDEALFTEAVLDEVSVIVPPPDVALPDAVTLDGAATSLRLTAAITDSGGQGVPAVLWSKVSGPGSVTFAPANTAATAASFSQTGAYVLRCSATTTAGAGSADIAVAVFPAPDASLAVWLKMNETSGATAFDSSSNSRNATLFNSPTWTSGVLRNALNFNGSSQYATLPSGVAAGLTNFTAAVWVKATAVSAWARVFDFGTGTTNYMFLAPMAGAGGPLRFAINNGSGEQRIDAPAALTAGAWHHVALTLSGTTGILYLDGVEAGRNSAMSLKPSSLGTTTLNYLGRSQFSADPYLNALLDDFRLYSRALAPGEIAALAAASPAPSLLTGPAPTAINGVTTTLAGTAVSELADTLTAAWSKISGPGAVTFGNPASPATTLTFAQSGSYVLRLTGTNSIAQDFAELSITAAPNPNLFADWQSIAWPGISDPAIIAPLADPEHDGCVNLIEYALGTDPTAAGDGVLPGTVWRNVGGTEYLALEIRRPIGRTGITYSAEATGDLAGWSAAIQDGAPASNGDGTETLYFRDTVPRGTAPRFLRLKITQP